MKRNYLHQVCCLTFASLRLRVKLILALAAVVLLNCQNKKEVHFNDQDLIKGNATPIQIAKGKTEINLEDYAVDLSLIDSISGPSELAQTREGMLLYLEGELKTSLAELKLWSQGQDYSIPLQKVSKTKISISYTGSARNVKVKGEFNAWNPVALTKSNNVHSIDFQLPPGVYQYVLILNGKDQRDKTNPDSIDNGIGGWNSVIRIPRPDLKKLPRIKTEKAEGATFTLALQQQATEVKVYWKNFLLDYSPLDINNQRLRIKIPAQAKEHRRSFIRIWAANAEGISNDVLIPLHNGEVLLNADKLVRQDRESQIIYFPMVDRFYNGNKENDHPLKHQSVNPKVNFHGGDLAGVTQKLKEGYFTKLGINTLWLSPITQNPKEPYGKYPHPPTTFSGYHGYWPISLRQIDDRFGTSEELAELIRIAHEQNINVILDYVAHHIHIEHPLYKIKPGWFTPLYLPDGTLNTERWDDERFTTWFDVFLPTLDLRKPEVVGAMTDTAMFWLENFNLDGFRHDASKHIDLLFWRELTKKIKSKANRSVFQIGETYGGRELVKSYINTGMLDAQFDFNIYVDAVNTFARDEVPFSRLSNSITESLSWFGDHHLMGNISGNQDRARFISYADGSIDFGEDAKRAGWIRKIEIRDSVAYKKLQALQAFNMTIPGIPVIYYGDEIGDPGANDPDNRRMMRFDKLNDHEMETREVVANLVKLRKENLALIYGDFSIETATDKHLVYRRRYFDNEVIVVFNKSNKEAKLELTLAGTVDTNFISQLVIEKHKATVTLPAHAFEIIIVKN